MYSFELETQFIELCETGHLDEVKELWLNIPYINFRRNIITKGINLSSLLNSEFYIGNVKIKANELCQPCKRLQDELKQTNFVKEMYNKSGLRGQILTNGKILVGDKIKY